MTTPLRCDEVRREFAAPTTDRNAPGLAAHLAACPSCTALSERDARLTRLWDATRPVEPSADAWDALWADVSARLDRQREAVTPMPAVNPLPLRRRFSTVYNLARAAAVLAAVGLIAARSHLGKDPVPTPLASAAVRGEVDIDSGQLVLIRVSDARTLQTVALNNDDSPGSIDASYAMFNTFEAMAN